jgi:uncharacterized protein with HEPN domain
LTVPLVVRSVAERLDDIMVALERIERRLRHVGATKHEDLDDDTVSIVAWSVLAMGEAVKALPPDLRRRHPGVDWQGLAGVRDRLAHQYFRIELDRVWAIIESDLPPLRAAVETEAGRLATATRSDKPE